MLKVNKKQNTFIKLKQLAIEGVMDPCDGYGNFTHNLLCDFTSRIDYVFHPYYKGNLHLVNPSVAARVNNFQYSNKYLICLSPTQDVVNKQRYKDAHKTIITMFEASRMPLAWRERLKHFDQIIVPCKFNQKILKENSIDSIYLPIPINTNLYSTQNRTISLDRPFRFLFLFASHRYPDDRKSSIEVLEAFKFFFANNKDIELIVKTGTKIPSDFVEQTSNIKFIDIPYTEKEMLELYTNVDCLVFPSKGEGFSMPPREAISCGLPVIISNYSAHTDLVDLDLGISLEPTKFVPAFYSADVADRHNNSNPLFGEWAYFSPESIGQKMKQVYDNYGFYLEKANKDSIRFHELMNREIVSENIINLLR